MPCFFNHDESGGSSDVFVPRLGCRLPKWSHRAIVAGCKICGAVELLWMLWMLDVG